MKKRKLLKPIFYLLGLAGAAGIGFFMAAPDSSDICMIAHRGFSGKYPQNTALAFRRAFEHGSGGAETDLRCTLDGVLVCSHGDCAYFADGTQLKIADNTFAALTAKPLKNNLTADEVYLCSFKEYLEICREYKKICFIELKGAFSDEKINECFNMAAEIYDLSKCILQSFNFENLLKARAAFPKLQLMLTFGADSDAALLHKCIENGISIDADYTCISRAAVKRFRDNGLKTGLWTVNDRLSLYYCYWLEPDFIESDIF